VPPTPDVPVHLDLTEGWRGDRVVVSVGGRERCRLADVTTRMQLGRASTVDLEVPAGEVEVAVALPERGIAGSYRTEADREVWVAVRVVGGALEFRSSEQPFGYV
jgi:hypothetical protein